MRKRPGGCRSCWHRDAKPWMNCWRSGKRFRRRLKPARDQDHVTKTKICGLTTAETRRNQALHKEPAPNRAGYSYMPFSGPLYTTEPNLELQLHMPIRLITQDHLPAAAGDLVVDQIMKRGWNIFRLRPAKDARSGCPELQKALVVLIDWRSIGKERAVPKVVRGFEHVHLIARVEIHR